MNHPQEKKECPHGCLWEHQEPHWHYKNMTTPQKDKCEVFTVECYNHYECLGTLKDEPKEEGWEERFWKIATKEFPATHSDKFTGFLELIRTLRAEAIQEGYNRGRVKHCQQTHQNLIDQAVAEQKSSLIEELEELVKSRKFEVEEKRTGALSEVYEAGYYGALVDIQRAIKNIKGKI